MNESPLPSRTYFGLEIVAIRQARFVRESDIRALPFYSFWQQSAAGSTMFSDARENYIYLHDWEAFATRFIATGSHRYSR